MSVIRAAFSRGILIGVAATVGLSMPVFAISAALRQQVLYQATYYSQNSNSCTSTSFGVGSAGTGTQSGSWSSGLQSPYIVQQFTIEVLKDIAKKMGASVSDTVTKEHVLALVAFNRGEGGDINSGYIFNLFHTGVNAPELTAGAHAGNGTQSFKSFDAGVEAAARGMTDGGHTRLSAVLTNPKSSADDFMYALTYFQRYPNNKIWAAGSDPAYHGQGQAGQDAYYHRYLDLDSTIRSHYAAYAGIVIGTPAYEEGENLTALAKLDNSLLPAGASTTANPTNDISGSTSGSSACPSAATSPTIAATQGAVYVVGDSLSVGSQQAGLDTDLTKAGWPATIKGAVGRSITGKGQGGEPNALDEVDADQALVKSAHVVVVVLGSNPEPDFQGSQATLIQKIKSYNPSAAIYWMNVAGTTLAQKYSQVNTVIQSQSGPLGYQIIDWFHVMYPSGNPTAISPSLTSTLMSSNQPHPNSYKPMEQLIFKAVTGSTP